MQSGIRIIIYPVKDLARAKALYGRLLGVPPYIDEPYYVGYRIGDLEVGFDPKGDGATGPIGYWQVDDIEASLRQLVEAGARTQRAVSDVGGGKRIATVGDADGNITGLIQMPAAR